MTWASHRRTQRAMTLLEIMVSITILAMVSLALLSTAMSLLIPCRSPRRGSAGSATGIREGRAAMRRINNELQTAFLSGHMPINPALIVRNTAFVGTTGSPADRVDFTSFSHVRVARDAHESDQNEISYFGSPDPNVSGKTDVARREQVIIDFEPRKGGKVNVLAENIDLFDLKYLDPMNGTWQETWDTTQATGQGGPVAASDQGGPRASRRPWRERISSLCSGSPMAMQSPLTFAVPR